MNQYACLFEGPTVLIVEARNISALKRLIKDSGMTLIKVIGVAKKCLVDDVGGRPRGGKNGN